MRKFITLFLLLIFVAMPGKSFVKRIEPENWWIGMKNPNLQLMVYGEKLENAKIVGNPEGIQIEGIGKSDNPNYIFINLVINKNAKSGKICIKISDSSGNDTTIFYPIFERKKQNQGKKGFSSANAIYLITPDRFANGNQANDNVDNYTDKTNRKSPNGRHGGDIQGISDNLDYIKNLGFTAIWCSPLLENNMPETSYHGYAITDFYKTDPRFGSNEEYFNLVEKAHSKGLKIIMDFVLNHCGSYNWWANDLPTSDWYHHFNEFTQTNYRASTLVDPHASDYDKNLFEKGWFSTAMPDLNQSQPLLATYLIQNTIWWIESANIDGIRLDTQPYSEPNFLYNWCNAIKAEYPEFMMVGEAWFQHEAFTASYQKNDTPISTYKSSMPSVTDFPLCFALNAAVNEKEEWDAGMIKVYNVIAHDFLYGNASQNMIFLDNHDLSRVSESIKGNLKKYKVLVSLLATLRGIPQFYYGTEIMMTGNKAKGDGVIRKDMPGGWPDDKINAFTSIGLNMTQTEAQNFTRKIFNWRKTSNTVCNGNLKHFIPSDGLYVYTRYDKKNTVLVLVNNNEKKTIKPNWNKYSEIILNFTKGFDPISLETFELKNLIVPAKTALILELN